MGKKTMQAAFLACVTLTVLALLAFTSLNLGQGYVPSYSLSGYVTNNQGQTVPGVPIYLIDDTGFTSVSTSSGGNGFYYMTASAGTYTLTAGGSPSGGLTYSEKNLIIDHNIEKNFVVVPGYHVYGYVKDASGNPVAYAGTNINNNTWLVPGTSTDGAGYYSVYMPRGTYTFIMWAPANSNLQPYANYSFTVTSDTRFDITLVGGNKISGYIRLPSGQPVSDVTVYAINATMSTASGHHSTSTGYYYVVVPNGTYTIVAQDATRSNRIYAESNVVVNGDLSKNLVLSTVSISPASAVMDLGQTGMFTANAVGGSGHYNLYKLYVNGALHSTQYNPTLAFTPAAMGVYSLTAETTDSESAISVSSTTTTVTVNSALIAPNAVTSKTTIDQGQQTQLSAAPATTGTSPYQYQWYQKAPNSSTYTAINGANGFACSFTSTRTTETGVWSFKFTVTDSATTPNTVASTVAVTVNPPPEATIKPQNITINAGQTTTFTANVTGGSYPLHYQWFLDNQTVGNDNLTYTYNGTLGSHSIYVTVTDSATDNVTATSTPASVTVNPALVAPDITPSKTMVDQTQQTLLTSSNITTGTGPYMLQWYSKAPGDNLYTPISGANASNFSFNTSSTTRVGIWVFLLNTTDSSATPASVTSTTPVTVYLYPTVTIAPLTVSLNVGQSQLFTATANGGSGNYTYQWAIDGNQITGQNTRVINYTFSSTGQHTLTVNLTDSLGITVTPATNIRATLYPAFAPPTLSSNLATLTQTQTSDLTAQVTTGTPTHVYKWYIKSPNDATYVTATNASSPTYSFNTNAATTPGTWSFKVQVTDATGETANSTALTITLNPMPTTTISPTTTTRYVGQNQQFNAQPTGGSGTYTSYQWYVNGAPQGGETASSFTFAPKAPASFTITVTVTDSSGVTGPQSNPANAIFQTAPTPTPTPTQPTPTPNVPTPTPSTSPILTPTATPTDMTPTPDTGRESNSQTYIILTVGLVIVIVFAAFFAATKRKTPSKPDNTTA